MPFYRMGNPGEDEAIHLNMGRKAGPAQCREPRFPEDNPKLGALCSRMSVALCDAPHESIGMFHKRTTCDRAVCELHRTKHKSKPNTDYCVEHKQLAEAL